MTLPYDKTVKMIKQCYALKNSANHAITTNSPFPSPPKPHSPPPTPQLPLNAFHVLGKEQAGQTGIHSKAVLWLPKSYKKNFQGLPKNQVPQSHKLTTVCTEVREDPSLNVF